MRDTWYCQPQSKSQLSWAEVAVLCLFPTTNHPPPLPPLGCLNKAMEYSAPLPHLTFDGKQTFWDTQTALNMKYENDLKYEDNIKYEDYFKYEDNLKLKDDLKYEDNL